MKKTKTYHITTFGCQMNEHDSETLAGMLTEKGYEEESCFRLERALIDPNIYLTLNFIRYFILQQETFLDHL